MPECYKNWFITNYGEIIQPGEFIELRFAGEPHDLPKPWKLVSCRPSKVIGGVYVMIEAADGKQREFLDYGQYDIGGENRMEAFERFVADPMVNCCMVVKYKLEKESENNKEQQ